MTLVIDNDILDSTGLGENELKLELSVALYKNGKLSLKQASKLAKLSLNDFKKELVLREKTKMSPIENEENIESLEEELNSMKSTGLKHLEEEFFEYKQRFPQ